MNWSTQDENLHWRSRGQVKQPRGIGSDPQQTNDPMLAGRGQGGSR